jgi:predicted MFS family arabinose efflux permease
VATGLIFISRLALPTEQSVGGGLFQTFIQLGSAMGTTIATLVYTSVAQNKANDAGAAVTTIGQSGFPKDAFLSGLQSAFWTGFAMALTG